MTGSCARLVRGDKGGGSTSAKNRWKTWPLVLLRVLSRAEAGRPCAEAEEFRGAPEEFRVAPVSRRAPDGHAEAAEHQFSCFRAAVCF